MIAKRQEPKSKSGQQARHYDYRVLGNYCRDANHQGEKCLVYWFAGCNAPDYDLALEEIKATQAMNTRVRSDKTYHLEVSFREEDEAKLTPEAYKKIELAFAAALGLSEHQRVCGVHKNTAHLHMHVAYNLIHPERLTMATTLFYDYEKLSRACRAMEKEFGLIVDNGYEQRNPQKPGISQHAAAMEAHTGEQSFQSYALNLKSEIMRRMSTAQSWRDAHQALAEYGIAIQPKANGFVLVPLNDKGGSLKASSLDKTMSKIRMEERFGSFVASEAQQPHVGEQQAFQDVVLARKAAIIADLEHARSWQDVHGILADHGLEIKPVGAGLVLASQHSPETMKASALDRGMSKMHLEKRFGSYVALPEPGQREEMAPAADARQAPEMSSDQQPEQTRADNRQSFQELVLLQREKILAGLQTAANWQELHRVLLRHGIVIRPRGNGLVLAGLTGKDTMKASVLDRSMSKMYLEKRFGSYVAPEPGPRQQESATEERTYQKSPRQPRSPERDQLYQNYQAALAEKIARIDAEMARNAASREWLKRRWQRMKAQLYAEPLTRRTRAIRMRMMQNLHRQDVLQERADHKAAMTEIRRDYPWYNWNGYLQHRAAQGDTTALDVLRSQEERRAAQAVIEHPAQEKTALNVAFAERAAARAAGAKWDAAAKYWYAPKGADLGKLGVWLPVQPGADAPKETKTPGDRLAYLVLQEKQRIKTGTAQKSFFSGCRYRIDNRGVAIISLVSGGTIRDAGKRLYFSPDEDSRKAARLYAMTKFGKHFTEKDNSMEMRGNGKWRLLKPHLGILRECTRHGVRALSKLSMVFGGGKAKVLLPGHARHDLER